jgi:type I restriction enzyme S subunit
MGWLQATLGDFVVLQRGHDLPSQNRTDGDVPVMGSFGITGYHSTAKAKGPGVTVGRSGASIGVTSFIERDYWPLNTCMYVTDFKGNNPRYAYYLLQTLDLAAHNSGSAQPSLNRNYIYPIDVDFPDRAAQDDIVGLLASLDDKIELNRRMNETLEEMARALFRDWFVDFGPTRRQMQGATDPYTIMGHAFPAGDMPAQTATASAPDTSTPTPLNATTLAPLFPAKLGENGLPEGWSEISFGEALEDTIGGDWGKEAPDAQNSKDVAIIRGTDFEALRIGTTGKVPQRFTTLKKAMRRTLATGDILLEVSGGSPTQPTGRSLWISNAILERFECDVVPASFCRRFRPKDSRWSLVLKQHLDDLYRKGGTWEYQNQSTGISNFQTRHFLEAEQVITPSDDVLSAFFDVIDPLVQKASTNENRTLAALRDLLLPKLMSGEIRLKG